MKHKHDLESYRSICGSLKFGLLSDFLVAEGIINLTLSCKSEYNWQFSNDPGMNIISVETSCMGNI